MAIEEGSVKAFRIHAAASSLALLVCIWISSGTMAPYAATIPVPQALEPCHYLANVDHDHFLSIFRMLDGDPRPAWQWSVVLRRLLFPLIAYPLMKLWGFFIGGVIASALLHVAAVLAFAVFIDRRFGRRSAIAVLWLLATYPGIAYWAALPYSYVLIVPGCLVSMIVLDHLRHTVSTSRILALTLCLGVLFTGYDLLLPFFALPALVPFVLERQFRRAAIAALGMILPHVALAFIFQWADVPLQTSNSDYYPTIIGAWLSPSDWSLWSTYLLALPRTLLSNFLFSNFLILPILGCAAWALARRSVRWHDPESLVAWSALLLFLFNNAAPPYPGWQLRGEWIARLYQPVFVALLMYIARATSQTESRTWGAGVALAVALNLAIVAGPLTLNSAATLLYQKFYAHASPRVFLDNLKHFGRRPLGFCEQRHLEEGWNPYTNRKRAPRWMFR